MNYLDIRRELEAKQFSSINEAIRNVEKLSGSLKHTLYEKIEQLEEYTANESRKKQMRVISESWSPIIDWECHTVIDQPVVSDESMKIQWHYEVSIKSDLNQLIDDYLNNLRSAYGKCLLKYSDKALLIDLHTHYRQMSNCRGLEVNHGASGKLSSVEDDMEYLMQMHFRVKVVECEGKFATGDYFDMTQANIPQPKTVKKALVSDDGSDLCIQKGVFVSPINNSNDD